MSDVSVPLLHDEDVMWKGEPFHGILLRPIELFLIPFSLMWAGFAVFWNVAVWQTETGVFFKLFGLPFLIAGLYFTVGRFFVDMSNRKATTYFVTNKRVLISRGSQLKSLDIKRLPYLQLDERPDGSGTIRFGASNGSFDLASSFGFWQPASDPAPQFIRVAEARSVYDLIQKQSGG